MELLAIVQGEQDKKLHLCFIALSCFVYIYLILFHLFPSGAKRYVEATHNLEGDGLLFCRVYDTIVSLSEIPVSKQKKGRKMRVFES